MKRLARLIADALVEFTVFNLMAGAEVANWLHRAMGETAIRIMRWQLSRRGVNSPAMSKAEGSDQPAGSTTTTFDGQKSAS